MPTLTAIPAPYATLDDLAKVSEKAELIAGKIVYLMASGETPGDVALQILLQLLACIKQTGRGKAHTDGVGFVLAEELPNGRLSFAPDVAYSAVATVGKNMKFVPRPPTFAVEVRSEHDYSRAAERAMAEKRADYLLAGTLVVWDVDPIAETVTKHSAAGVTTFTKSETADAEPALPGWRVKVADLF